MSKLRASLAIQIVIAITAGLAADALGGIETFQSDINTLTSSPHRRAGYEDGSIAASKFVEKRLREIGFTDENLHVQTFPVIQPITTECELIADGQSYQIYPAMPNILQASITPEEGLTGQTMYVGNGDISQYGNRLAKNRIVVIEFDSGKNWQRAFAFGARAVIFIGSDKPAANPYHHVNIPANFPRFYVKPKIAEKLQLRTKTQSVKLSAACNWKELRGRNVIAVIRGTDPVYDPKRPDQAVLLVAPLDSISEIPDLAPSARWAANCAGLLQITEHFHKTPPKRDIIVAFVDGQAVTHMGMRAFYGALYRRKGAHKLAEATLKDRLERLLAEQKYQQHLADILNALTPLTREYWQPWGKLYATKADLLHTQTTLQKKLKTLNAHKDHLKDVDYPAEDITARLDLKIAKTTALLEKATGQFEALSSQLDEQMVELDRRMEDPKLKGIKLFSTPDETSTIEDMPRHSETVRFLREETKNFDSSVLKKLAPLRLNLRNQQNSLETLNEKSIELRKKLAAAIAGKDESTDELRKLIDENFRQTIAIEDKIEATTQQIDIWYRRNLGWNSLMKVLFKGDLTEKTRPTRGRFARIVEEGLKVIDRRTGELEQLITEAHQAERLKEAIGRDRNEIVLHLSINLSDARDLWTFVHGDDTVYTEYDKPGNYSPIWKVARKTYQSDPDRWGNFDKSAVSDLYANRLFAPGMFADSGGIAGIFAIQNIGAVTSLDNLPREGQPCDTLSSLNIDIFHRQLASLTDYLGNFVSNTELNLQPQIRPWAMWAESEWTGSKSTGASVLQAGAGSAMPDRPVRDAIAAVIRRHKYVGWRGGENERVAAGFVFPILAKTDTTGIYEVGPYSKKVYEQVMPIVATFDKTAVGDDEIPKEYKTRGLIDSITTWKTHETKSTDLLWRLAVHLFKCRSKSIVGFGYNRGALPSIAMRAISTAKFRKDRYIICEVNNLTAVFAPANSKGLKLFNKAGIALLNNKPTKAQYKGMGISLDDQFDHPVVPVVSAHDLGALNGFRLKTLRDAKITDESLVILDGEAHDVDADTQAMLVSDSDQRPAETVTTSAEKYYGDKAASAALSRRAYTPLIAQMKDLVTAVVLLLLLAMPFAFALERLLIGSPHIYRQIAWFAFFFLLTFIVLYFVNPAFRIAATPAIIFLAFTIILLSSLVIFIMVRKLQAEIKKMQGLATSVHSADVSRLSTLMAAVSMGISTMRRRPVRTLLTAVTVVLLTFTILTFASFGSKWDVGSTYKGPMTSAPPRILVRQQLWSPIAEGIFEMTRGHLSDRAEIVPRYWIASTAQDIREVRSLDMMVASDDGRRISPCSAAIGLDIRDVERQPDLRDLFYETDSTGTKKRLADYSLLATDGIILTDAVAHEIGMTPADIGKTKVLLAGRTFTYAGIVSDRMAGFSMVDGSSMLPVDYQSSMGAAVDNMARESKNETSSEMPDVESAQFVYFNIDQVLIIPPKAATEMKGRVRAITVYPNDVQDIMDISRRAAMITELPSYAGYREGVYRMFFRSLASASGVKELLIPVILGGLIVFATMLGSVSDREREIYTFSSLGLAPAHVASLFFAEASIYAVVGGMGGYLLGQIVARGLGYLGQMGLVTVPTMNYSSTNAIVTVLIVMSTVLISTIYPALKASKSANPGIQRAWKIPKPEGDLYDLVFPFTVSAYDIIGVVSFLKEHFDNYSDTSIGVFASIDSHVFRQQDNDMLGFAATVALAPFDLGVTQEFCLLSQPSDIEGIDQVRIMIHRQSGAHGDWQRSNRIFVDELRKQLLIWRSLSQEIMDKYREKTLANWDDLPLEQADRQSIGGQA